MGLLSQSGARTLRKILVLLRYFYSCRGTEYSVKVREELYLRGSVPNSDGTGY